MLRFVAFALLLAGCATLRPLDPATLARLEPLLGQLLLVGFDGRPWQAVGGDWRVSGVITIPQCRLLAHTLSTNNASA